MECLPFQEKVVVVTGGGSGIGRATAEAFLCEGARVVICGRSWATLRQAAREMLHNRAVTQRDVGSIVCDMSRLRQVERLMRYVTSEWGRLDVMVNNAGEAPSVGLLALTERDIDACFTNNLKTTIVGTQAAALVMKKRGGVIVNVSSFAGQIGVKGGSLYSSAKSGVMAFTRVAAGELAPLKIRVNCVVPGVIETEMVRADIRSHRRRLLGAIAMKRFGVAREVANGITYLASEQASYITGAALEITGGKFVTQY